MTHARAHDDDTSSPRDARSHPAIGEQPTTRPCHTCGGRRTLTGPAGRRVECLSCKGTGRL